MKTFKNLSLIVFLFVICFGFFNVKAQSIGTIYSPKNGTTYYRGEVINYKAVVTNYDTVNPGYPFALITKENSSEEVYKQFMLMVPGETQTLSGSFSTKNIKAGTYHFVAYMNYFTGIDPNVKGDLISTKIYIKDLKKPTQVKAVAKKKKIKITYKAVNGATKYNIYRSKKKSKGYKLIGSTTKTKYKDKKVKKGKKYYYKVQSIRAINGTITSSYSKKVYAVRY